MIGEYIRSLRSSGGLSQKELAERIGISPSMLSLVESDRRDPTIRLLRDVARALEIPPVALFAAALDEGERPDDTAIVKKFRSMTTDLMAAVQHTIVLQRLQRARNR